MSNAFDSANYPTSEPVELIAGDRWAWKRTDLNTDYSNSTHVLKYVMRLAGSGATEVEITASASGTEYLVEVVSATTAAYSVGRYYYQGYITRTADSQRITVADGEILVIADRDISTSDPITVLRQRLDNLQTAVASLSTKVGSSYSIAGRSFAYTDLAELIRMRNETAAEISVKTRKSFGVRA